MNWQQEAWEKDPHPENLEALKRLAEKPPTESELELWERLKHRRMIRQKAKDFIENSTPEY